MSMSAMSAVYLSSNICFHEIRCAKWLPITDPDTPLLEKYLEEERLSFRKIIDRKKNLEITQTVSFPCGLWWNEWRVKHELEKLEATPRRSIPRNKWRYRKIGVKHNGNRRNHQQCG